MTTQRSDVRSQGQSGAVVATLCRAEASTSKAPDSASAESPQTQCPVGRKIAPLKPAAPSTVDALTGTIASWSRHAGSKLGDIPSAATMRQHFSAVKDAAESRLANRPTKSGISLDRDMGLESPDSISAVTYGNDSNDGRPGGAVNSDLHDLHDSFASQEAVTWCGWDHIPRCRITETPQRALLIAYATGGLQIYTLGQTHGELCELVNFQQVLLPEDRVAGRILCAKVQVLTGGVLRLLLLTRLPEDGAYLLATCSLDSHIAEKVISLPRVTCQPESSPTRAQSLNQEAGAAVQINSNYAVVSHSQPPALHILHPTDLYPMAPPITDFGALSLNFFWHPVSDLSGRLLAYACAQEQDPHSESHPSSSRTPFPEQGSAQGFDSGPADFEHLRTASIELGVQANGLTKWIGNGLQSGARGAGEWGAGVLRSERLPMQRQRDTGRKQGASTSGSATELEPDRALASQAAEVSYVDQAAPQGALTERSPSMDCIRVLDLSHSPKAAVATFRCSKESIASLRMSRSGRLVAVADAVGHVCNVFEICPRPRCTNSEGSTSGSSQSVVVHRARLLRGMTRAQICDMKWSPSQQDLCVLTRTGAVHVFHLGPLNGVESLPRGATLTAFARSPRPKMIHQHDPSQCANITRKKPILASSLPCVALCSSDESSVDAKATALNLLTFHPGIGTVYLASIQSASSKKSTSGGNPTSHTDSSATASSPISGLTALMRSSQPFLSTLGYDSAETSGPVERSTSNAPCKVEALWTDLLRSRDDPEIRPSSLIASEAPDPQGSTPSQSQPTRGWVSLAEVQTYDATPRVLSAPLYLSHQVHLSFLRHGYDALKRSEPLLFDIYRARAGPMDVRETVQITHSGATAQVDYHDDLATAIGDPGFERNSGAMPSSPSSRIPSFPQGHPARTPNWRTSVSQGVNIPLRLGAAAARELDGVRRRRTSRLSPSAGHAADQNKMSLSFDEDVSHDAHIFADAKQASPSPNGGKIIPVVAASSSWRSARDRAMRSSPLSHGSGSDSPFAAKASSLGEGASSAENTPPTVPSDCDDTSGICDAMVNDSDDDEAEERAWAAARGFQEDVEGDALGWDSFADPEFGGQGLSRPSDGEAQGRQTKLSVDDDFMVGALTLDEDVSPCSDGQAKPSGASTNSTCGSNLPAFNRKSPGSSPNSNSGAFRSSGTTGAVSAGNTNQSSPLSARASTSEKSRNSSTSHKTNNTSLSNGLKNGLPSLPEEYSVGKDVNLTSRPSVVSQSSSLSSSPFASSPTSYSQSDKRVKKKP